MIIHLGVELLPPSSNLPESLSRAGLKHFPIWSCSTRGLPSHQRCRRCWCALTTPFHPYLPEHVVRFAVTHSGFRMAVSFLLHFPSRYRAWGLPSALPSGVRTFLSGLTCKSRGDRSDHPSDFNGNYIISVSSQLSP
jgi:hypothetical protein